MHHDAGVVDDHVRMPFPIPGEIGQRLDLVRVGDVANGVGGRDAEFFKFRYSLLQAVFATCGQNDLRAFGAEGRGEPEADACGTAGNDDDFIFKFSIFLWPSFFSLYLGCGTSPLSIIC